MKDIVYRKLRVEDCELINGMDPSQYIGKAWRAVEGERQLVKINYQDLDWPNGYEYHYGGKKARM